MNQRQRYYKIAKDASAQIGSHPGLRHLKSVCSRAEKILDLGCGEGTRLQLMAAGKPAWGVDIDKYAITQARRQYPQHNFQVYSGQQLPFPDNHFSLVYSTFVLEHTLAPEQFLAEAIRVTRPKGQLILLCPNFGAPNRRSPNSRQIPFRKLCRGIAADFSHPSPERLNWERVTPKSEYGQIDDDTTVEPYLPTLAAFLEHRRFEILKASSLWDLEPMTLHPRKLLFLILGRLGVHPVKHWGPQIFVAGRKF